MKFSFFSFLTAALMLLFSCNQNPKLLYSCDAEANEYAIKHKTRSENISRDELAQLPREIQFAVWRSLSPVNKKRIFNEKIDLLLTTENLTPAEQAHLLLLKNYFVADMYDNPDVAYFNNWESYARNQLGWDINKITAFVGMWVTINEINSEQYGLPRGGPADGEADCTCMYDIACSWAYSGCVDIPKCKVKGGCGILGYSNCSGRCSEQNIYWPALG